MRWPDTALLVFHWLVIRLLKVGDTSIRCANRPSKALTKLRQSDVVIDIIIPLRYFCCAVPDN